MFVMYEEYFPEYLMYGSVLLALVTWSLVR